MTGHLFHDPKETTSPRAPLDHDLASARFARVAVERGIDGWQRGNSEDTLTYRIPHPASSHDQTIEVGQRVLVPLGRGDKLVGGFVVQVAGRELLGSLPPHKAKPVTKVERARLPAKLIALASWIAEYYVCPLGMVLASMVPAAVKDNTGRRRETLLALAPPPTPETINALKAQARDAWMRITTLPPDRFPISELELKLEIQARTLAPINQLLRAGLLQEVEREVVRAARGMLPLDAPIGGDSLATITLSREQESVIEGIDAPPTSPARFAVHLLLGVTGSGKTEVYLRLLARTLERGLNALMLVPEISLTPQTAGRLMRRLGGPDVVAVLHSGLTASQRHAEWARVASGSARVVIGARSAVFAPLERIGLVIVDEEHATDYKQDQLPRYHARDVAIKRAQLEACPVLLGSATPSLESWANATQPTPGGDGPRAPRFKLWRLTTRVAGGTLPSVQIVDLARERQGIAKTFIPRGTGVPPVPLTPRDRADKSPVPPTIEPLTPASAHPPVRPGWSASLDCIGPTLHAALTETLSANAQAILLLNRRGFASQIACAKPSCGWVLLCDDCDAAQVWHRSSDLPRAGVLRCHHCLAERTLPNACPQCHGRVVCLGIGTQRVEEELLAKFPILAGGVLARADGDSIDSARDWFQVLSDFQSGRTRVLLGTQMIAKGHDFAGVRLVGVINADTSLMLPDFRAGERTFQLVAQVAGRAGRGRKPGLVIVQTFNPQDPSIVLASRHDYETFARRELEIRRRSHLPPATRLARVIVRDRDFTKARTLAEVLAQALEQVATPLGARVLGPAPCTIARIAQHHRLGIEVFAPSAAALAQTLGTLRRMGLMRSDATTAIDVDPVSLA